MTDARTGWTVAAEATEPPAPARWAVLACLVAAVASLPVRAALSFDPWAWLVWGREVTDLALDTTGGPSWKPLPVLVTTLLAPLGDAAPVVWMVLARAGSLLAFVAVYRLARRLAGPAAGWLAAGLLVLTPGGGSRMLRLVLEGHADPAAATFCLWAIDLHLGGRRRAPLLLLTGAALLRPEVWPFLGLYAVWLWRERPADRPWIVAGLASVPLLWFGGDWWGSGDPWHGADAAQVGRGSAGSRLADALDRVLRVVALPVWAGAALSLAMARARRRLLPWALAGLALSWFALVAAMAGLLRYAALNRFLLPGAGLLCVLAGAGVVQAVTAVPERRTRRAVAALLIVASAPFLGPRIVVLSDVLDEAEARTRLIEGLEDSVVAAGGRDAVLACGGLAVDNADLAGPNLTAAAWHLDLPLARVDRKLDGAGLAFAQPGGRFERRLLADPALPVVELDHSDTWVAYAVGCDVRLTGQSRSG